MTMIRDLTLTALPLCMLALYACNGGPPPGDDRMESAEVAPRNALPETVAAHLPAGISREEAAEGREIFEGAGCHACHGSEGEGTQLGPPLRDMEWIHISGELDEIERVIVEGISAPQEYATAMPPQAGGRYDREQLRALAAYVYALSRSGG